MNAKLDAEQRVRWLLQQVLDTMNEVPRDVAQQMQHEFQQALFSTMIGVRQEYQCKRTRFSEMRQPLPDRAVVRHKITDTDYWLGIWNEKDGVLECCNNGEKYEYPSTFCKRHYETTHPDRTPNINAWKENTCQVLVQGEWVSLHLFR